MKIKVNEYYNQYINIFLKNIQKVIFLGFLILKL